ncbi:MAG: hypothetical protein C5B57_13585, partial [Blastocatellia bacterium]
VTRFSMRVAEGQPFTNTGRQFVAISADGTQIVFSANAQLFLRSLSDLDAHAIAGSGGGPVNPTFSPDGRSIAFWSSSESVLKRIPASGGAATPIAKIENPFGMSWDEDGIVIGAGPGGIYRVSGNGGTPQQIVSVAADETAYGPQILPGGRAILFTLAKLAGNSRAEAWDDAQIVVQSLPSGTRMIITRGSDARYLPSGHLLYTRGGTVYAVAFDSQSSKASEEAIVAIDGVSRALAVRPARRSSVCPAPALWSTLQDRRPDPRPSDRLS